MKNIKENESYLWYMARRDQMAYMKLKKKYRREVVILSIILIVIITCDTIPAIFFTSRYGGEGGFTVVFIPFVLIGLFSSIRQMYLLKKIEKDIKLQNYYLPKNNFKP